MKKPDPKIQRLMSAIADYMANGNNLGGVTLRSITADLLTGPVQAREALTELGATEIGGKWHLPRDDEQAPAKPVAMPKPVEAPKEVVADVPPPVVVAPEPVKIDWSKAPDWARAAVMTQIGMWCWIQNPDCYATQDIWEGMTQWQRIEGIGRAADASAWRDSKVLRPAETIKADIAPPIKAPQIKVPKVKQSTQMINMFEDHPEGVTKEQAMELLGFELPIFKSVLQKVRQSVTVDLIERDGKKLYVMRDDLVLVPAPAPAPAQEIEMQQPEQVQPQPQPVAKPVEAQPEPVQQPTNLEGWVFIDESGTFKTAPRQTAAMAIDAMEQLGNRAIDELIKAQGLRLAKVRVVTDVLFVMGECA